MDSSDLHVNIDFLASTGVILNAIQKSAMQTSLRMLQARNKYHKVYFWGKILGIQQDYFIAQGITQTGDEFFDRKNWYSRDCARWRLLPVVTETMKQQSKNIKGRFVGNPTHEFEYTQLKPISDQEDPEEETIVVKEEDRLSAVIFEIDNEVRVIPRSAYILNSENGKVEENKTFEGLTLSESNKLCNYSHFRPSKNSKRSGKHITVEKENYEPSLDFMDAIDQDIPNGAWCLKHEKGSGLIIINSLLWIGYHFFHVPETHVYGSVYFGTGEKNIDLPFML